ncbi:MAG: isoprenylcysteine carboxylmethyltransferase family protein [Planctomycetota bacterium]
MKETAYLLQATLIAVWWVGLTCSSRFFNAFQFSGISPTAFWSFFGPDILVIAGLSLVRAYRANRTLELIVLGAFAYAALYCCNATAQTNSGYLPTGLMFLGLLYNSFLCFPNAAFRTSSAQHTATNALKTLIQIVCTWALALVAVPYVLLDAFDALRTPTMSIGSVFGTGLFVACSLLGLTSAFFLVRDGNGTPLPLDQTNSLVMSGPYRYVCNPMAIAGIGQGIAIALIFLSIPLLIYSLLGALVWHCVVRPIEERDLKERFGDAYTEYRRAVSCWIPTFK